MSPPDVSVVVVTFNRAGMLRGALESLLPLETGGTFTYEIVVVDNASTDTTPQVVQEIARQGTVLVRYVREARPGAAAARNRGISEAAADWIAFFDDDQLADRFWLKELLGATVSTGARFVGGPYHHVMPEGAPPHLIRAFTAYVGRIPSELGPSQCNMGSGNMLVHRSVFHDVGTFDEGQTEAGEDADLLCRVRKAGIATWFNPKAIINHLMPLERLSDLERLRRSALRTGWSFAWRDCVQRGRSTALLLATARAGQALCLGLPRWVWGRVTGNPGEELVAYQRFWLTHAYGRGVLYHCAPRVFPQSAFRNEINFRAEAGDRVSPIPRGDNVEVGPGAA